MISFGIHKDIMKEFKNRSTCTVGQRGDGKDMLMSNVAVRRNKPYISNINYDGKTPLHIELDLNDMRIGNDCFNFINGDISPYKWKHGDGVDIYISDCSVYFPNYKTLELNKKYEDIVNFLALSRQVAESNVHINAQNLVRVWEKFPEQSDVFIRCLSCRVIGRLVLQHVRLYELRDSCEKRIPPLPRQRNGLKPPTNFERQAYELQRISYQAQHGIIKDYYMVYINRSNYDTRRFKTILEGGLI